jgi:hypothetical protein
VQDWAVTSAGGVETFLVIASRERIDSLELALAALPAAELEGSGTLRAASDRAVARLRGVARVEPRVGAATVRPSERLADLAQRFEREGEKRALWMRALRLENPR